MWETAKTIIANPVFRGTVWTVLTLVAGLLMYRKLKSKLITEDTQPDRTKTNRRLLGAGLLFVLLIVLVTIWTAVLSEEPGGLANRARSLLYKMLWTWGLGVIIYVLVGALQRRLIRDVSDIGARHRIRQSLNWGGVTVFLIAAALLWVSGIRDFGVFLGIIGAGIALSLQETLLCLAGWFIFITKRPYDIGDRIEIDGHVGDVIGVSAFQTTMLEVGNWVHADQSTGRLLIIPNSMLVRSPVYNYVKGSPIIWDEISAIVTFESDWEQAERLMLEKADVEADKIGPQARREIGRMQRHYAIHYEHLTPMVYTSIADNGVNLTLRYLCKVRDRRTINHRLSRNILQAFLDHPQIDFAYNTTRIFRNNEEGKLDLGGPAAPPK